MLLQGFVDLVVDGLLVCFRIIHPIQQVCMQPFLRLNVQLMSRELVLQFLLQVGHLVDLLLAVLSELQPLNFSIVACLHDSIVDNVLALVAFDDALDAFEALVELVEDGLDVGHLLSVSYLAREDGVDHLAESLTDRSFESEVIQLEGGIIRVPACIILVLLEVCLLLQMVSQLLGSFLIEFILGPFSNCIIC